MALLSCALTHPGLRRPVNEDSLCARPDLGLFVVADGLGGHAGGQQASRIAIEAIEAFVAGRVDPVEASRCELSIGTGDPRTRLRDAVALARARLAYAEAEDARLRGMGTTMAAVLLDPVPASNDGRRHAVVAHVGDSRVYLLRQGELQRLTTDHSWVEDQVRAGLLEPEAASRHPWRSLITRAINASDEEAGPEFSEVDLQPGDRLLLCSDGLSSVLTDEQIEEVLSQQAGADPAVTVCEALVHMANLGGGPDNITVIVVAIQ
jgi:serine/threonine protein phosphatase PrpC